ncbi:hypothetical protein JCM14635_01450 [Megalodesulfovibrio paquesii]
MVTSKLKIPALLVCLAMLAPVCIAHAQLGLPIPDLKSLAKPKGGAAVTTAKTFSQPTTFRNTGRRFEFTLPAGWMQESGNVQDESGAVFQKGDRSVSFLFHMTQMVPSFPAEASVSASLKQAKEEIQIRKLLSAKRRDGGVKAPGSPRVIGWEVTESEKGSGGFQRIIWQCYDQDNYYFNFMVSTEPANFQNAKAEMQQIIDSIVFK